MKIIPIASPLALVVTLLLAGCVPSIHDQQPHAYAGQHRKDSDLAIVYGENSSDDGAILVIKAVDEISTTLQMRGARKVFVLPGDHLVTLGVLAGDYFSGDVKVRALFDAGHSYQLRHQISKPLDSDRKKKPIQLWFEDKGTNYLPPDSIFPSK